MTWLAWRQFRAQAAVAAAVTMAVIAVLLATRGHIARTAGTADLSTGYQSLRLLGTFLIGVPALIGAFWGAPLLARELETGTHRLAWTQSVTRGRWLAVKLGVVGLVGVLATAAFSLVFTWWSLPFDRLGNRVGTANFGQRGIAPIAYALFALLLGTLLGAVTRRTLPAMAGTLVGFFVARFGVQLLVRPHLMASVTVNRPMAFGPSPSAGGWALSSHTVDAAGHRVSGAAVERALVEGCRLTRDSTTADYAACAKRLGLHDLQRIQPGGHFWALQAWEAALFLALAAVLAGLCFWWVRHRTA
jgi:hypothetical protein